MGDVKQVLPVPVILKDISKISVSDIIIQIIMIFALDYEANT